MTITKYRTRRNSRFQKMILSWAMMVGGLLLGAQVFAASNQVPAANLSAAAENFDSAPADQWSEPVESVEPLPVTGFPRIVLVENGQFVPETVRLYFKNEDLSRFAKYQEVSIEKLGLVRQTHDVHLSTFFGQIVTVEKSASNNQGVSKQLFAQGRAFTIGQHSIPKEIDSRTRIATFKLDMDSVTLGNYSQSSGQMIKDQDPNDDVIAKKLIGPVLRTYFKR